MSRERRGKKWRCLAPKMGGGIVECHEITQDSQPPGQELNPRPQEYEAEEFTTPS